MKGEILFEKMTDISDEFVSEAAIGGAFGNPRREKEENVVSRFLNSGWGVAVVCAFVSLGVIVALVRWGQAGTPAGPAGTPSETTSHSASARFEFSYDIPDAEGTPQATATYFPGDSFTVNATVINRGLPFVYKGSSSEFCPDVRFIHRGEEKTTVLHGGIFHTTDVGTFLVGNGEKGQGSYFVEIPWDAPEGSYDLVLSYKNDEQVFPNVLTVGDSSDVLKVVAGQYSRPNDQEDSRFTITLNEDGTYSYYETMISSHVSMGTYTVQNGVITLVDANIPTLNGPRTDIFRFKYENDTLLFLAEESDEFMYVQLPDGAVFQRTDTAIPPSVAPDLSNHPFSFGYEGFPTEPVHPGDTVEIVAYVVNEGEAFTYIGDPYDFQPTVRLYCQNATSPSTTIYGFPPPTGVEPRPCTVEKGQIGKVKCTLTIPENAEEGLYSLSLSYGDGDNGHEECYESVLEVTAPAASTPVIAPDLDEATDALLREACAAANPSIIPTDISVHRYYGTYASGAVVAIMNDGSYVTTAFWSEQVGPANIHYSVGTRILVLYGQAFLTLQEAYHRGALTAGDLATIENIHRQYFPYHYSDPDQ